MIPETNRLRGAEKGLDMGNSTPPGKGSAVPDGTTSGPVRDGEPSARHLGAFSLVKGLPAGSRWAAPVLALPDAQEQERQRRDLEKERPRPARKNAKDRGRKVQKG